VMGFSWLAARRRRAAGRWPGGIEATGRSWRPAMHGLRSGNEVLLCAVMTSCAWRCPPVRGLRSSDDRLSPAAHRPVDLGGG
jgi:hypothetical protein